MTRPSKEDQRKYNRKWRAKNPDKVQKSNLRWKQMNPDKVKKSSLRSRWKKKIRVLKMLGGVRCLACSETDIVVLTVDHIFGGGGKERALRNVGHFYWDILKGRRCIEDLRCLCYSCQARARVHGPDHTVWASARAALEKEIS